MSDYETLKSFEQRIEVLETMMQVTFEQMEAHKWIKKQDQPEATEKSQQAS